MPLSLPLSLSFSLPQCLAIAPVAHVACCHKTCGHKSCGHNTCGHQRCGHHHCGRHFAWGPRNATSVRNPTTNRHWKPPIVVLQFRGWCCLAVPGPMFPFRGHNKTNPNTHQLRQLLRIREQPTPNMSHSVNHNNPCKSNTCPGGCVLPFRGWWLFYTGP